VLEAAILACKKELEELERTAERDKGSYQESPNLDGRGQL
jgi:hypothetical protein